MTIEQTQPGGQAELSDDERDALQFNLTPEQLEKGETDTEVQQPEQQRQPEADHDDDDDDDQRGVASQAELEAATDAEREQIREQNRQNRKNKTQRQRARIDNLERQLREQQRINQEYAQRFAQADNQNLAAAYAQLQQGERQAEDVLAQIRGVIADATTKGDGNAVAEMTEQMVAVMARRDQIRAQREQFERAARQQSQAPRRPHLDQAAVDLATGWQARNSWYKGPKSTDPDSVVLNALDATLTREGLNPAHQDYWDELDARASRYLPHRFGGQSSAQSSGGKPYNPQHGNQRSQRSPVPGAGAASSGGGDPGANNPGAFRLNAERVRLMKEAGMWDDPKMRKEMIRKYQEHDRQAKGA